MYRLIIADDEQIECRALEHKIRDLVDGIELLPSAGNGIELLKSIERYRPDIAIVDINMPGLNGLEAIELLRMKQIELKIIINTSYSDFAYIQKALQLGASDYLLKPGNQMTMANAIRKVCRELDNERLELRAYEKNKAVVDSLYQVAAEKWLLSLIWGQPDENCGHLLAANHPEITSGGVFTAWRFSCENTQSLPGLSEAGRKLTDCCRQMCHCLGVECGEIYYVFFMFVQTQPDKKQEYAAEMVSYGCRKLRESGILATVGISRYKDSEILYADGIWEAKAALSQHTEPGLTFFRYVRSENTEFLFCGMSEPCAKLLSEGKIQECINHICQKLCSRESEASLSLEDLELLRIQTMLFLFELEREAVKLAGFSDTLSGFHIRNMPEKISGSGELCEWVKKEIPLFYRDLFIQPSAENPYIEKALIYIHENYINDISLEDAAGTLGISSFYLSRLFRQEKKTTFLEVLTSVRIRKAIQLLRQSELPIRDICRQTGYSSLSYFYRVFKKQTGLTVGTMRRLLNSIK